MLERGHSAVRIVRCVPGHPADALLRGGLLLAQLDQVAAPLPLGPEISEVVRVARRQRWNAAAHPDPFRFEPLDLERVVGDQVDRPGSEVLDHPGRHVVAAQIVHETQRPVRFIRVRATGLQRVGANLVPEADAPPFLPQVDQRAALRTPDQVERVLQLLAAVALERPQDLAGQALAVHTDRHAFVAMEIALHGGDVLLARALLAKDHRAQGPVARGERRLRVELDQIARRRNRVQMSGRQTNPPSTTRSDARQSETFLDSTKTLTGSCLFADPRIEVLQERAMHQIEAEFTFAAAHRLPRYEGKCFNLQATITGSRWCCAESRIPGRESSWTSPTWTRW